MLFIDEGVTFPESVVVLFNPWSEGDTDVFYPAQQDLARAVLPKYVYIPKAGGRALKWRSWQFEPEAVEFLLDLLSNSDPQDIRVSAADTSRHLAFQMSPAGQGKQVVKGLWPSTEDLAPFSNQSDPVAAFYALQCQSQPGNCQNLSDFHGSDDVIQEYLQNGPPVKFGQCWVFAGTLGTALQTAGIPCRPVSCLNSGAERTAPLDTIIDYYYEQATNPSVPPRRGDNLIEDSVQRSDEIWGFHTWQEVWLASAGDPEWHALDATPYEYDFDASTQTSSVRAVVGPLSVSSILNGQSGQSFDLDVYLGAVKGSIQYSYESIATGQYVQDTLLTNETPGNNIGIAIAASSLSRDNIETITASYKTVPPPPPPGASGGNVNVAFMFPPSARIDQDLQVAIALDNVTVAPHTMIVELRARMQGQPGLNTLVFSDSETVTVPPNYTVSVGFAIPSSVLRAIGDPPITFVLDGQATDTITEEHHANPAWNVDLIRDALTAGLPVTSTGHTASLEIVYENLNSFDATNVVVSFVLPDGLLIAGGDEFNDTLPLVAAGTSHAWSIDIDTTQAGEHEIFLYMSRDNSLGTSASTVVSVVDCPADLAEPYGFLDFTDVSTFLVAYDAGDPVADFDEPYGVFDFSDVLAFMTAYGAGCFE